MQPDQTKLSNNTAVEDEENMALQEKEVVNDKIAKIPNKIQDLDAAHGKKSSDRVSKKEKSSEKLVQNNTNLQTGQTPKSNSVKDTVLKNQAQQTRLTRSEKNDKKINIRYKNKASSVRNKTKKSDGKQSNKKIDKYFGTPVQCQDKITDIKNVNRIQTEVVIHNSGENADQDDVIFEGTVINSSGDTSIIMPLETGSFQNQLRLDNVEMADGSEIVQAQEIVWISNNSEQQQLPEPKKPKIVNSNKSETTLSPAEGDEAEIMKMDGTLIVQTSGQDMDLTTSTEKVIVLEVQLPAAKENVKLALPKCTEAPKRNRCVSNVSKSSAGKSPKISDLMTDEQKKEIETLYSIDMTLVDETKVNDNISTLSKSKFQCKICNTVYARLDKCQVSVLFYSTL